MIPRESANFDARPDDTRVSMLVLHYTGMTSADAAIERLCDPAAKVSAHYVIDEDGTTLALVPEERRAWHAGTAHWRGIDDVNGASIGIELVNPGHAFGYRSFPDLQIRALVTLAHDILARHRIPARNVVGHSDVAPDRRKDPGELFDWQRLAATGIGVWPAHNPVRGETGLRLTAGDAGQAVIDLQAALVEFGYALQVDGGFGPATQAVVRAFQRHFRRDRIDGIADAESVQLVHTLLNLLP